jgi:hypothetical protein
VALNQKKSLHQLRILYKPLKNKFRANKLIKNLLKGSSILQLKLTLFKEITLSLSKKITNVGSNLFILKNVKSSNVNEEDRLKRLIYF